MRVPWVGLRPSPVAQQVGGQAACQLHLVLNVAIIVEVPVEAIPARRNIPCNMCIPLSSSMQQSCTSEQYT